MKRTTPVVAELPEARATIAFAPVILELTVKVVPAAEAMPKLATFAAVTVMVREADREASVVAKRLAFPVKLIGAEVEPRTDSAGKLSFPATRVTPPVKEFDVLVRIQDPEPFLVKEVIPEPLS